MFDRDELGDDPELDTEEDEEETEVCPVCLEPWDDCQCENEEDI